MKKKIIKYIPQIIITLLLIKVSFFCYIDYNSPINVEISLNPYTPNQTTTIYAAYSSDGKIPNYVINYLKTLKEISPNIIYITDNPIHKKEISKLKPYVTHLIAQRHNEYDWGSYKIGFNWLKKNNYLITKHCDCALNTPECRCSYDSDLASPKQEPKGKDIAKKMTNCCTISSATNNLQQNENKRECRCSDDSDLASPKQEPKGEAVAMGRINCCAMSSATNDVYPKEYTRECRCSYDSDLASPLLILANDSTIPTTPSFASILADMKHKKTDFYGITANQDGTYHIQSYFLIITAPMYNHPNFAQYLNSVTQQQDGLTVAYRYEVPFTQYFANLGFTHSTFIDYNALSYLPLNDKNCYPLTMLTKYNTPLLKMRTFTNRLNVQEPRRLVFNWLRKNKPDTYKDLITHLKNINSPYLNESMK